MNKQPKQTDEELPIFIKWMEFLEWLMPVTSKFPKAARFSFSQRIEGLALDIAEELVEARYSREKRTLLRQINIRLEKLRVLFRLSQRLHYLSHSSYEHAVRSVNEAGSMLGGWVKQQEQK